ncbi:MAG: lipoprotein [Dokdonella sp.]|uniref:LPS translocon maturation chaperone LptM n=1 Tax=Dokdonella sp. TaxID=2291710 RepID=UPI0025C11F1D|nr:lipoprotein [Dokdonella sp.]MBZ0224320.1 lipoprotein [Dokdonella sp.]
MSLSRRSCLFACGLALSLLAGCGNKGPLARPDADKAPSTPAASATPAPPPSR